LNQCIVYGKTFPIQPFREVYPSRVMRTIPNYFTA